MPECPRCGSRVEPGDRFCPSCGGEVVAPPPAAAAPVTSGPARPGLRKALLAGCGCLALLGVGTALLLVVVLGLSGDATKAARAHVELLAAGDVDEAWAGTSRALREVTSLESYRQVVEARPALRRVRDVSFPERHVEGDVATLTARLEDDAGRSFDVPMRLREEGDTWRLIAVDWSDVPPEAPPPQAESRPAPPAPATGAPAPRSVPPPPATRPSSTGPSVGAVVIGSGRDGAGRLVRPGAPVQRGAARLSADIELVDHPRGGRVLVWVERADTGARSEPVKADVEGEGSGTLTFNLDLGEQGLPPGAYRLVVLLGEEGRFETPFRAE